MISVTHFRAGWKAAPAESLPLWLAAEKRERCACRALTDAGRWLQRRVPGLAGPLADAYASANGLGVRHDR